VTAHGLGLSSGSRANKAKTEIKGGIKTCSSRGCARGFIAKEQNTSLGYQSVSVSNIKSSNNGSEQWSESCACRPVASGMSGGSVKSRVPRFEPSALGRVTGGCWSRAFRDEISR